MLALGMAGAILMPLSGFWLLFLQAVLILAVAWQNRTRIAVVEAEPGLSFPGDQADQADRARKP